MFATRLQPLLTAPLLALLLGGCAMLETQVKQPEVSVSGVQVVGMSLADAQLAVDLEVKNPNPVGLSMRGLSYELAVQQKELVHGALGKPLGIGANATSAVTLPLTLRYEELFGSLLELGKVERLEYRLSGEADFGLLAIPYLKEGTLPVPRLPEVSVQRLRVERFTLRGVDLALALKVKNGNNFPITLSAMEYNLKLGEAALLQGRSGKPLSVKPRRSGELALNLSIDYAHLGAMAQSLRSARALPVEFHGRLAIPGLKHEVVLPYKWQGNVPLSR